jgi:hypothetical protein
VSFPQVTCRLYGAGAAGGWSYRVCTRVSPRGPSAK